MRPKLIIWLVFSVISATWYAIEPDLRVQTEPSFADIVEHTDGPVLVSVIRDQH